MMKSWTVRRVNTLLIKKTRTVLPKEVRLGNRDATAQDLLSKKRERNPGYIKKEWRL